MKRTALVLALLMTISVYAYAGEYEEEKCVGQQTTSKDGKNKYHLHEHCYTDTDTDTDTVRDRRKNPAGIGVDIPLYKSEKFDVENQNKYDFRNSEYSNFTVVKINAEEGLFQKIFKFLKKETDE